MLIMRGARINVMNRGDDTPLHLAASHGHRDIVAKVNKHPVVTTLLYKVIMQELPSCLCSLLTVQTKSAATTFCHIDKLCTLFLQPARVKVLF